MYTYYCELCNVKYTNDKEEKNHICESCKEAYKITDDYVYYGEFEIESTPNIAHKTNILTISILLLVFFSIFFIGISSTNNTPEKPSITSYSDDITTVTNQTTIDESSESDELVTEPTSKPKKKRSKKSVIKKVIENRIENEYNDTYIEGITINENLATKKKNDYIALVYLTWNVRNSGTMSKEMLSMYSEDLAVIVGEKCPKVKEICVFWTVPYLNDASAKCAYERRKGKMYLSDSIFDYNFYY